MKKTQLLFSALALTVSTGTIVTGCSPSNQDQATYDYGSLTSSDQTSVVPLYLSDLDAFSLVNEESINTYDGVHDSIVTKIFGGTDSSHFRAFYSDRIKHYVTYDELRFISSSPAQFRHMNWLKDPEELKTVPKNIKMGAANISTDLWINGVLDGVAVSLNTVGGTIALDSTHEGVMLFGEGYEGTVTNSKGQTFDIPPEYRQSILLHEARHADCTGGLSQAEIENMRDAKSREEVLAKFPLPHCGHLHILCPSGPYKGLPACDAEKYGAYFVGGTYAAATADGKQDAVSRKILQTTALDNFARYIKTDTENSPDEQAPNMTSEGVLPQ
jgi:hypothetical protein